MISSTMAPMIFGTMSDEAKIPQLKGLIVYTLKNGKAKTDD